MIEPADRARALGISREAIELWDASDVVDAHVESFVWSRVLGYDLGRRHGSGLAGGCFYSQADLPRMVDAALSGVVLSVATNPFRRRERRTGTLLANLARLRADVDAHPGTVVVADHAGYRQARQEGKLACFLAVQGGNALGSPADLARIPDDVVSRITLVHLTASPLGRSSAPGPRSPRGGRGLTSLGAELVEAMNARRVIVDLAHISPEGFWDALDVHDRGQPAIVSHTGVRGVHDVWRNLDDAQVRAIGALGGVVGVMFHSGFLGDRFWSGRAEAVVDHLAHIVRIAGEDSAAIGSDYDGLIVPPTDLRTVTRLPVLAQRMLDRGFGAERIAKVLGRNYLRVVEAVRPGRPDSNHGGNPDGNHGGTPEVGPTPAS
ncbi:MAG TPA: membrane dipeptidase [Acidimicrobiales bacterium]|jgi:membrane dipeptidase|nr:membrane dipeptidase [Acidimicrobiales bacterium]